MALYVPKVNDGDWNAVRRNFQKLTSIIFGPTAIPTFAGLTLTDSLTLPYLTEGSVLFAGPGGLVSQDNDGLFWDDTNKRLGVGRNNPPTKITVIDNQAFSLTNIQDTIHIIGLANESGSGAYGGSIGFNRPFNDILYKRRAAIACVQHTSDPDQVGLVFFTHPSTDNNNTIVEAMRITHDAKVGIGTDSPNELLHIKKVGAHAKFEIESTTDNATIFINCPADETCYLSFETLGNEDWQLRRPVNKDYLAIYDTESASEVMVFENITGNIGINTPTPDTKLQVVGNCKFGDDNTNYAQFAADGALSFIGSGGITVGSTVAIGLDMSGGTFATASIKLPGSTIQSTGDIVFQPTVDSATAWTWKDLAGATTLTIDSTNERVYTEKDLGTNLDQYTKPSFVQDGSIIAMAQGLGASKGSFLGAVVENVAGAFGGHFVTYDDSANPDWLIGISKNVSLTDALVFFANSSAATPVFTLTKTERVGVNITFPVRTLHVLSEESSNAGVAVFEASNSSNLAEFSMKADSQEFGFGVGGSTTSVTVLRNKFYLHDTTFGATRMVVLPTTGFIGWHETDPETFFELTHAQPYITLHNSTHEDIDGGRESRLIFKGEQSGGEETELAVLEVSHDGTSDDQLGKVVLGVNTGAGVVDALAIVSTTDWVINKTAGVGIKVDLAAPTFGFRDLLGDVFARNVGASKPSFVVYRDTLFDYQFGAGDEEFFKFHIPHDYVIGTDIFIHVHWSHTGTLVNGGTLTFEYEISYSKGYDQAAFGASVGTTFTGTPSTTQYQQIISEVQVSAASPSASQIDSDNLEPDGVIIARIELNSNDLTVSSGGVPDPFIHYVDIHYQSTNISTKDKNAPFYS